MSDRRRFVLAIAPELSFSGTIFTWHDRSPRSIYGLADTKSSPLNDSARKRLSSISFAVDSCSSSLVRSRRARAVTSSLSQSHRPSASTRHPGLYFRSARPARSTSPSVLPPKTADYLPKPAIARFPLPVPLLTAPPAPFNPVEMENRYLA